MKNFKKTGIAVLSTMVLVGSVTADQQILDDLIVDGSACIGQDCVNGESFGFDTLRLKENNLRIGFQDTSASASFPSNDWELTANDSSNGGANKFSITDITGGRTPFTIEAAAPSNSLYVDDGGRVGLGTATPVVELHVVSGDSATMRLEQDGSSGFTPQTWDVAGNETNFFVRDATNGSKLPFKIKPNAPTNSLFVDADGEIGLGTAAPAAGLDLRTSSTTSMQVIGSDAVGSAVIFEDAGALDNARDMLTLKNNGTAKIQFENTAGGGETWEMGATASSFFISKNASGGTEFFISESGNLTFGAGSNTVFQVNGTSGIVQVNGSQVHPDYVFEDDYELPSIEDQASFMFENKHLPSLPKAPEGLKGPVNLLGHQMGILEEVEKAHIYIDQLNKKMARLEAKLAEYEAEKK